MAELENKQNTISADSGKEETWLDRLADERAVLGRRLGRLEEFMRTRKYEMLDREEQDLLLLQRESMRRYAEVLDLRLVRAATHRTKEEK